MMYYLTSVRGISDGTEGREILKFTDLISARATLHTRMGSAMNDDNCIYAFAVVNDLFGNTLYRDSFRRETTETEA